MCRLKLYSLSQKCVWRLISTTGCFLLILGAVSFGFGMKLMEFADKPDITPVFTGIPMIMAGFLGLAAGLCKKGWLVTFYGIVCVIISMLSIHMNYRFMGKELPFLPLYRSQCLNKQSKEQYHCDKYLGTVMLSTVSVLMLPFIIAGLLACVAAKRTLKKKNCYMIWFTCGKVEPAFNTSQRIKAQQKHRQINEPVGLLSYKKTTSSKGFVCEIPETSPTAEYLPRIPDFTDLAGRPDSPGYPASVMFELKNEDSHMNSDGATVDENHKGRFTKTDDSSKVLESGNEQFCPLKTHMPRENLVRSGTSQDDTKVCRRWKKENSGSRSVATSEVDLSLIEQDYLNRRSYLYEEAEESGKYYEPAAEERIHKLVDNLHDSRCRLYGVSDEEDLDDVPKREFFFKEEEMNAARRKVSTESQYDNVGNESVRNESMRNESKGNNNTDLSTTMDSQPGPLEEADEIINIDRKTSLENGNKSGFSITKTSPPRQEMSELGARKISRDDEPTLLFRKRKFGASSPYEVESDEPRYEYGASDENPTTESQSESLDDSNFEEIPKYITDNALEPSETKDLSPHGIVTPVGQTYPTGSLRLDLEDAPTEHARKNWVEFEGESEAREKLLKGKMTLKEYEELTSYIM